ncbi:MAG: hypothetical protein GY853_06330 [PVC group bacterium]|nr:hypothetical protein [PVC group bacterium]
MFLYIDEKKTVALDDIVALLTQKTKKKKQKTIIITKEGKKYYTQRAVQTLVARSEGCNGLIK